MKQPLKGIRILAIEQFGAGPYGSMYMADMGAEIIKIENRAAGGDPSRQNRTYTLGENDSEYFQSFNLNKKSVTLNLKNPAGQDIFRRMVATADVVWNNLRGNQAAKLSLDYQSLSKVKSSIICTHISAYGRDNDRADWPGYDYLMQAECGFLSLTGEPDAPPSRFGLSIVDFMTGVVAGFGTLAALLGRDREGGCDVDVSLFDVALHQLTYPGIWYLNHGHKTGRLARSAHPSNTPVQLYTTSDGWIFVMAMMDKFWQLLAGAMQRDDLLEDSRFQSMSLRTENRDALTQILDAIFVTETTQEWIDRLQSLVPVAPVYDIDEALDNPVVAQTGMLQTMQHGNGDTLQALRNPLKLDGERFDGRPGNSLGADNEQILGEELNLAADLQQLRKDKII